MKAGKQPWSAIDPNQEHLDDVLRYAYGRLGCMATAEDVVMEVYLALATRPRILLGRREPRLYVIGIARRKVADQLRRQNRPPLPAASLNGHAPSADALAVSQALQVLEPDHREVLVLRLMQGFSARETAKLMGRTPEAIDALVHRAKAAFRTAFTAQEEITDETQLSR